MNLPDVAVAALFLVGMLGLWLVLMVKGRREHYAPPPRPDPFRLS